VSVIAWCRWFGSDDMSPERAIIRRAEVTDLSKVASVARATWHVAHAGIIPDNVQRRLLDGWYSPESLSRALAAQESSFFVAESSGEVIGFALRAPIRGVGGAHANLRIAGQAAERHRDAVARRGLAEFTEEGLKQVTVQVERDNRNGRRFYERAGFAEPRELTHDVQGYELALVEYRRPILGRLLSGLAMGESPRWHENRLWLSDWGAQEIVAIDLGGNREVVVRTGFDFPFCIDWHPNGRLLIVSGREGRLRRRETDGSLVTHADLCGLSDKTWNEIVVDGRGKAYVNGVAGTIAMVGPDGPLRRAADGLAFPNGIAVTPDNATLIVAESHARKLTAFAIATDGCLFNRRVRADLGGGVPDGICIDADNAVWYADVPNKRCVRVPEGGAVLQRTDFDRGCFACTLGGTDKTTLFLIVTEGRGMDQIPEVARARTGQGLTVKAPAPGVGWP
jgi:sugar lactone lactonase YvrE/ribosomal protein S18 acetylase RimI-like enzyme